MFSIEAINNDDTAIIKTLNNESLSLHCVFKFIPSLKSTNYLVSRKTICVTAIQMKILRIKHLKKLRKLFVFFITIIF